MRQDGRNSSSISNRGGWYSDASEPQILVTGYSKSCSYFHTDDLFSYAFAIIFIITLTLGGEGAQKTAKG